MAHEPLDALVVHPLALSAQLRGDLGRPAGPAGLRVDLLGLCDELGLGQLIRGGPRSEAD